MPRKPAGPSAGPDYTALLAHVSTVLEQGRRAAARSVNAVLAATYWQIGRHIVEHGQWTPPRCRGLMFPALKDGPTPHSRQPP